MRANDPEFATWSPGEAMLAARSGLRFDWLDIEDDGESFAALRALSRDEKQALFAACVARTVKPQLAFEPQARPELEATVARLGIDFAQHVRRRPRCCGRASPRRASSTSPAAVLSPAWASARARNKKGALADAMEAAFAAGGTPVGLSAPMHAAALAWTPPGFAAFDTGRTADEADGGVQAETPRAADTAGTETPPQPEPAQPPARPKRTGRARRRRPAATAMRRRPRRNPGRRTAMRRMPAAAPSSRPTPIPRTTGSRTALPARPARSTAAAGAGEREGQRPSAAGASKVGRGEFAVVPSV